MAPPTQSWTTGTSMTYGGRRRALTRAHAHAIVTDDCLHNGTHNAVHAVMSDGRLHDTHNATHDARRLSSTMHGTVHAVMEATADTHTATHDTQRRPRSHGRRAHP
jgi:hypothetical protein